MRFRVVAERPVGLFYGDRPVSNPFAIRDVFSPRLRARVERRTWPEIEAADEAELRRLFTEYTRLPGKRGFAIVSVEPLDKPADPGEEPRS